ncbi:MAG TPA: hypothetical protein VKF79_03830 [Candidatus Acidoferrum sp.]|nr:hypothetical protein [Candidatus Acidoferrum sp.]
MSDANTSPVLDSHDTGPVTAPPVTDPPRDSRARLLTWSSFLFALLQSFCSAVIAISGIRLAIGLTALAAAAGVDTPAKGFHSDAIRIPMMAFALVGALVNLYLLWNTRRLRNRPSAQWRRVPLTPKKKASERVQLVLSVATLVLLAAEWFTHPLLHRVH